MGDKKLLFVIHSSAPSGGAEDDIENLLIKLKASGNFEIHALLPEGPRKSSFIKYLDKFGNLNWGVFPVINKGFLEYIKYFLKSFVQFIQIRRFAKNEKYDLVLFSVAVLLWPIVFFKANGNRNIVFIKETIEPVYIRRFIYKIISRSSIFIIPNSKVIENEFREITGNQNVKTIYSSVSKSEYELKNEWIYETNIGTAILKALDGNSLIMLMIGNLVKIKNPIAAVKAAELLKNDPDISAKLFIVGKDDVEKKYADNVIEYIGKNDLDSVVYLLGFQQKAVLEYLFQKVDFLIIPSLSEGIPLVLVYALKFRVPVITTSAGGISDIIKDSYNGIIVEPDAQSIYEAVKRLKDNPDLNNMIRENGYSTFIEKFNLDRNINEIMLKINELI